MIPPVAKEGMLSRRLRRGLLGVVTVFFCYVLFCQFFFVTHAVNGIFRPLSSLVFVPAAEVQNKHISYRYVVEMAHGLEGFAGATERKDIFDRALAVSVYRLYIKVLADELDVKVTKEDLAAYPIDQAVIAPGLELARWNETDYRKFIIKPLLLAQKTEAAVSANAVYQAEALETMESLRRKLAQGMPFADVAEGFSQDASALSRGDLGIMSMGTLMTWLQPATTLAPGDISEILHAPNAYWTVTLIEYFPSEVAEQAAVHFRGIAVKKKSFGAVVGDAIVEHPAWVFIW